MVKNTTYLHRQTLSQSLDTVLSKPAVHPSRFLCQLKCRPYNPEKIVPATINAPYSLDFCAVINAVRTAINAARTVNKNLDFCARKMPRKQCWSKCSRTAARPYSTSVSVLIKAIRTALNESRTAPRFLCWLQMAVSIFFLRKTRALLKLSTSSLSSLFSSCKNEKWNPFASLMPFCLT